MQATRSAPKTIEYRAEEIPGDDPLSGHALAMTSHQATRATNANVDQASNRRELRRWAAHHHRTGNA